jgi:hypothetical protein
MESPVVGERTLDDLLAWLGETIYDLAVGRVKAVIDEADPERARVGRPGDGRNAHSPGRRSRYASG